MEQYLYIYGISCTIQRQPPVATRISQAKSALAARDIVASDAFFSGLALKSSNLATGDLFTTDDAKFLVRSTNFDPASGQIAFRAAKTNTQLTVKRLVETVPKDNESGDIAVGWNVIATMVDAFSEARLRSLISAELGLKESIIYVFWLQGTVDVEVLDRLEPANDSVCYQVEAVDKLTIPGLTQLQATVDVR